MVSIIKNQLLKHLSRFTKNLSADKINLSTFKGEGELTNLELDENVLTELLELPSWLRLTHAWCNRVTFRIQWTKLKNVPIHLNLDEVHIEVETCAELRSMSSQTGLSSYMGSPGKYSFIHKVIDGITVAVNTVSVTFRSPAFIASVQMSRIIVESVSPNFKPCELRFSRLKDPEKGQLLIFKELVWQTVRIEAQSTKDPNLTPLRLLTNQARCRITIKKRISDCLVLGSRLVLILDDLLWVLTDSQMKAALLFLDSLAGLVQKATDVTRKAKAARKLEMLPEYQAQISQQARAKEPSAISKIFNRYDVIETSYHFLSQRIDLHLCDDPGDGRSLHPNLREGGALQISLLNFHVDYYPYHLAIGDRKHWPLYRETQSPHTQWLDQALSSFRNRFMDLIDSGRTQHAPLARMQNVPQGTSVVSNGESVSQTNTSQDNVKRSPNSQPSGNPVKQYVLGELAKMMTSCVVLRVQDFTLYKVTTTKKQTPKEFIAGDRDRFTLPEEMPIFHAEFTYYYYPGETPFPLPPPKFYVQLNPIQVIFDVDSCLWVNSFVLQLHKSLSTANSNVAKSNLVYIDVKIEAIMPRIIFESSVDHPNQRDRPKSLHFQISRASITNIRSIEHASLADLAKCIDTLHLASLFFGTEFPSKSSDFYVVSEKFIKHINATDNVRDVPRNFNYNSVYELARYLSRELFWSEARDVWCIHLEPVWADFYGTRAVGNSRPIPFLDAFPVTLWAHLGTNGTSTSSQQTADVHCVAHISNLVSLQINHYQVLFLLRLAEEVAELSTFLGLDTNRILHVGEGSSLIIGTVLPQLEISLVMPSQCPGKESSGGDLESVLPDSSSIADDLVANSIQWQATSFQLDGGAENKKVTTLGVAGTPVSEISSSFSFDYGAQEKITTQAGYHNTKPSNGSVLGKNAQSVQPFSNINISKDFNAGFSSMKKGFSSFITSIDSAIRPGADDASDTMSVRSDISSDSENYVLVNMQEECSDAMFRIANDNQVKASAVEVASEVIEEDNTATTPSEHSVASSYKRRDLVSMATFKLGKVEFIQQSKGQSSSIKLQVSNVKCEECGSIPWDEFQNKFSSRSRVWIEAAVDSGSVPCVKLRFNNDALDINPNTIELAQKMAFTKLFSKFMEVQVHNVALELSMSTVTGLADLLEDEIIIDPIPVQVDLKNISLDLNEDRPPNNITSPGPLPINVNIEELHIKRDASGLIKIEPAKVPSLVVDRMRKGSLDIGREFQALQISSRQLQSENDELKRRLAVFERLSEENLILRRSLEETETLRACLSVAQNDVDRLLEEKKELLDRIRDLQDELNRYEVGNKTWSAKR